MIRIRFWLRLVGGLCMVWILAACGASPAGSTENPATANPPAATPGDTGDTTLEGTEWQLVEYGPADVPMAVLGEPPITVKFDDGNQIGGSGGCNSYGGTFKLDGETFSVGEIRSTMMACEDNARMQQEAVYLAALGSASSLQHAGDELTLNYDGGRLRFTRMPSAAS